MTPTAIKNEKIKLKATFLNNVSVGVVVGGALLPFLFAVSKTGEVVQRIISGPPISFIETAVAILVPFGVYLALSGGFQLHRAAVERLNLLQVEPDKGA